MSINTSTTNNEDEATMTIRPPMSPIPKLPTETNTAISLQAQNEAQPTAETTLYERDFLNWGSMEVSLWLRTLSLGSDISQSFRDNNITGETLPYLTNSHYEEMGIQTADRVKLKVEINKLIKLAGSDREQQDNDGLKVLEEVIEQLSQRVSDAVQQSYDELVRDLKRIKVDYNTESNATTRPKKSQLVSPIDTRISAPVRQVVTAPSSSSSLSNSRESMTPISGGRTPQDLLSRKPSLAKSKSSPASNNRQSQLFTPTTPSSASPTTPSTLTPSAFPSSSTTSLATTQPPASASASSSKKPLAEPLKQLRASTEDPCSKILQAAMKRHNLTNADWRNYALVICYGDQERILGLDEKPVLVFKELRARGEHPAIMLRQRAESLGAGEGGSGSNTPGGKL